MLEPLQIRDLAVPDRPRERLVELGAPSLSHAELLAILLRTGLRGSSAVDLGNRLMTRFGSLEEVARAPLPQLCEVKGIGRDKAATLKAAFELARRLAAEARRQQPLLDTPASIADALRDELSWLEAERFIVASVTTRRHLIRTDEIGRGILDTVLVHAREVFRPAILANAHAVVLIHNHPGGDPSPSEADIRITRDLIRAGQLLRIEVLDHVILGRRRETQTKDYCSLKELGHFYS
ncbi:MAG TPA: DNA repair protein RadC [Verrucomicrobiota bacterium]|nr:DNA repair protein RadC [Verrucomicrobiota bacterium]